MKQALQDIAAVATFFAVILIAVYFIDRAVFGVNAPGLFV